MKAKAAKWVAGLLVLSLASGLLTGCWDQEDIENRALVLGMAIDEVPAEAKKIDDHVTHLTPPPSVKNRMIRVTAQIAVPGRVPLGPGTGSSSDNSGTANMPVWVVKVEGHTLDDALNNLQQEVADPRTLIHLRVIIISEAVAKRGLEEINDYLRRNPEVRRSTWLLISDEEAEKFMNVAPPLERVPTLYLLGMIEKAVEMGKFPQDDIGHFWSAQSKWGKEALLPYISIRNKENILIKGFAYFREQHMVGTTSPIEIGDYMAMKGIDPAGYTLLLQVPSVGAVMANVTSRQSKISAKMVNGKPQAFLNIHLQAKVVEKDSEQYSLDSSEKLKKVEIALNDFVKKSADSLVVKLKADKSDVFGFGECFRAHHRSYWRANIHSKADWNDTFSQMPIHVTVNSSVIRVGLKNK